MRITANEVGNALARTGRHPGEDIAEAMSIYSWGYTVWNHIHAAYGERRKGRDRRVVDNRVRFVQGPFSGGHALLPGSGRRIARLDRRVGAVGGHTGHKRVLPDLPERRAWTISYGSFNDSRIRALERRKK